METTVLVVDDETEIRRTLRSYLELCGYRVKTAPDGLAALDLVRRDKIHVVLLDLKMPGMDGLTVLEKIREIDFSVQVIVITGYSTFDSTLQALEKGAADYVLKPFKDLDEVVALVKIGEERLARWKTVLAGSVKSERKTEPEG